MPCYFAFGNDNVSPICNHNESAHAKLMCCGSILHHQLTIDLFAQNLPCKASNALKCGTRSDGDVTSRNLTPMHKMLIGVAFQNLM